MSGFAAINGANVAAFLAMPSSANLAAALTDETGSGLLPFATSPSLITPTLGVAAATSINFGGTALANYLEATWTPTIIGSSTAGTGQTYSSQAGTYERIGRIIIARFSLIVTGLGTAAGNALIGGLPATAAENGYGFISSYSVTGLAALNYGVSCLILNATTSLNLYGQNSTGNSTITLTQTGAAPFFQGIVIYRAA